MSAIMDMISGVNPTGHETEINTWDRIKHKYPPQPPQQEVNPVKSLLDSAKEALEKEFGLARTNRATNNSHIPTGVPIPEMWRDAIQDAKNVRQHALDSAIESFKDASGKSTSEMEKFMNNQESIDAERKIHASHLSYDGSMILCVLLSMKETVSLSISNLPEPDQEHIKSLVQDKFILSSDITIQVKFDDHKDFLIEFRTSNWATYHIVMINSVAHSRPEDLVDLQDTNTEAVRIKDDKDKIVVGGKILLDKKGIKRLIGVEPLKKDFPKSLPEDNNSQRRQPVAGRNAFEIRSDLVQMSIDLLVYNKHNTISPEDVINTAKTLYAFVENKR